MGDIEKKDLTQSVLSKIESKKVEPKAEWHFSVRNLLIWLLGFISLLFGALSISVTVFIVLNADFDSYEYLFEDRGFFEHVFSVVPYFWSGFFVVALLGAYFYVRHTQRGYRYTFSMVAFASLGFSVILGISFYYLGFGHVIDRYVGEIELYEGVEERRERLWVHPERGVLAGEVVTIKKEEGEFELEDFKQQRWLILGSMLHDSDWYVLEISEEIALLGKMRDEFVFEACAVKPWGVFGEHEFLPSRSKPGMASHMKPKKHPPFREIKQKLHEKEISERNIFQMRTTECER